MPRRDSDATSLATGGSVSRVNSQHDPKTVGSGSRLFRPSGGVSWIKYDKIIVLDPSLLLCPFLCPGMAGAGRSPYNPAMPCSVSDVVA